MTVFVALNIFMFSGKNRGANITYSNTDKLQATLP